MCVFFRVGAARGQSRSFSAVDGGSEVYLCVWRGTVRGLEWKGEKRESRVV